MRYESMRRLSAASSRRKTLVAPTRAPAVKRRRAASHAKSIVACAPSVAEKHALVDALPPTGEAMAALERLAHGDEEPEADDALEPAGLLGLDDDALISSLSRVAVPCARASALRLDLWRRPFSILY